MERFRIIYTHTLCVFALLVLAFLSWQYMTMGARHVANDYAILYKILHKRNKIYHRYYHAKILKAENVGGKVVIHHGRPAGSMNLNTPLMSSLIQILVNVSNTLINNTLVWTLVSFFAAGISLLILMRMLKISQLKYFFSCFLLLYASWPSLHLLKTGQVSYILFPLLSFSFYFIHKKRSTAAAITLGLLASLKLFFLIFLLFFIVQRQWRFMWLFIFSFSLFFFLPAIHYSWSAYHAYFQLTQTKWDLISRSSLASNGSVLGFVSKTAYFLNLNPSAIEIKLVATILSAYIIIAWLIYDYYVLQHLSKYKNELRFSFLITLTLLCSPLGWIYYFVYLLIPVSIFFVINKYYKLPTHFYIYLSIALALPFLLSLPAKNHIFNLFRQFSLFISLLLWLICIHVAAFSIQKNYIVKSHQSNNKLIRILIIYVVIGIIQMALVSSPFFTLNKNDYIRKNQIRMWIPEHKVLSR